MQTLREAVADAQKRKVAIGHFNISNLEAIKAAVAAAVELNLPIIIGVSEGERAFVGPRLIRDIVTSLKNELNHPIYLNADHTYTVSGVKEAIDLGYDSVIFDGSKLSFEDNIIQTKECVAYAQASGQEILVEGELGYIGTSSKVLDAIPDDVKLDAESLTSPLQAEAFVSETGIDLLAPAVGNIHGMLRGGTDPSLDIQRIKNIADDAGVPLVLHGGSGTPEGDFIKAVAAGMCIVHISTELRVAYRTALVDVLNTHPDEVAPYKLLAPTIEAMKKVVVHRLKMFNNIV